MATTTSEPASAIIFFFMSSFLLLLCYLPAVAATSVVGYRSVSPPCNYILGQACEEIMKKRWLFGAIGEEVAQGHGGQGAPGDSYPLGIAVGMGVGLKAGGSRTTRRPASDYEATGCFH
jgi:hypothetical protein